MFKTLASTFSNALSKLTQGGKLTDHAIQEAIHDIRTALIDADVSHEVVDLFISDVREKAIGLTRIQGVNANQQFTKIIHDELVKTLSHPLSKFEPHQKRPAIIVLAGLQGAGKTTTAAKLALWFQKNQGKDVGIASVDPNRPAAIAQLEILAESAQCSFIDTRDHVASALSMADHALQVGKKQNLDILILDLAGRQNTDAQLMSEARDIISRVGADHVMFTVDSMQGQTATHAAREFHSNLNLPHVTFGTILTKVDADSRGGAALSVRHITQSPIYFMGTGEKIEQFDHFDPERIANRILDLGDIVSLVKEAEASMDRKEAEKSAKKFRSGQFDFNDFYSQLTQINKMGGVMSILDRLPGTASIPQSMKDMIDEKEVDITRCIIQSMTPKERAFPHLLKQSSRQNRIAKGSGNSTKQIKTMLKKFEKMQKMIKKLSSSKMGKMFERLKNMDGFQ